MKVKTSNNGTITGITQDGSIVEVVPVDGPVKVISRDQADHLISSLGGAMHTVCFTKKKDGAFRAMNGRRGVTKHLKGGVNLAFESNPNLRGMFDTKRNAYRSFDLNDVTMIKARKTTFVIDD